MNMAILMMISILIVSIITILFNMMSHTLSNKIDKKQEFECGFNSLTKNRLPFSTQFFLITILFLIFDLEISIIMPIASEESKNIWSMLNMMIIVIMLTMGLLVEWKQGMVEWSK